MQPPLALSMLLWPHRAFDSFQRNEHHAVPTSQSIQLPSRPKLGMKPASEQSVVRGWGLHTCQFTSTHSSRSIDVRTLVECANALLTSRLHKAVQNAIEPPCLVACSARTITQQSASTVEPAPPVYQTCSVAHSSMPSTWYLASAHANASTHP